MPRYSALVLAVAAAVAAGGWKVAGQSPAPMPAPPPADWPHRLADLELQLRFAQLELGAQHPNLRALRKKLEAAREVYHALGLRPDGTSEDAGRFAVTSNPQAVVMVDTKSGESWYLRAGRAGDGEPVWVPIKRQAASNAPDPAKYHPRPPER